MNNKFKIGDKVVMHGEVLAIIPEDDGNDIMHVAFGIRVDHFFTDGRFIKSGPVVLQNADHLKFPRKMEVRYSPKSGNCDKWQVETVMCICDGHALTSHNGKVVIWQEYREISNVTAEEIIEKIGLSSDRIIEILQDGVIF